jgi:hypothetical protein
MDTPLTSFTPIEKQASIGLSPKVLLLIFLYPEYLAVRGMASPELPFAFLLCCMVRA